ncbi:MAG: DNA polymerase III subunit delta [Bacteroidetes bacterium]|nr:DNA polymerase III subunit delta [Bacteroidota bacterium]MCY4204634.1 DNA polymerase III subunit delta [Bacteroidota bacterium]
MTARGRKHKLSALEIFRDLERNFREGKLKPMYLFYGDESYLPDQLQKTLIKHQLLPEDRDFNLDVVYGSEITVQSALGMCQMAPMLTDRRIVVIRGFEQLRNNKLFASLAKRPNPAAVVLLICETRPRFNADPYRALKKNSKEIQVAEFTPLWRNQAASFARGYAKDQGFHLEQGVEQLLVEFLGTGLAMIVQEIEKLITYTGSRDRKVITKRDVLQASGQSRDINVFELQDAITERRALDAHRIAERLLLGASSRQGEVLMIVAVLTSYFVKLWKLHESRRSGAPPSSLPKQLGVPPNMMRKYHEAARRWPLQDVERAMQLLLSMDSEIKGFSKRSPRLIMTLFITRLLSEPSRQHAR